MTTGNNRKIYLDVIRIVAIFWVIYNHVGGLQLYKVHTGISQAIDFVFATVTVINVPLFFMVSGSLLLDKEESFKKIFTHRILRFIKVIVFFTIVMTVLVKIKSLYVDNVELIDIKDVVQDIIAGEVKYLHIFWFMYAYIGFLVMLPFLREIAKGLNKEKFIILMCVVFVYHTLIPCVDLALRVFHIHGVTLSADFTEAISIAVFRPLLYPLIGYYIDKKIDISIVKIKHLFMLFIMTVAGITASSLCTYFEGITFSGYTVNYLNVSTYMTAIFVFILIKWVFNEKIHINNDRTIKIISCIGEMTFGMYVLDPFIRLILLNNFTTVALKIYDKITYHQIFSVSWTIFSMIISGAIILILKKIPFLKSIL